MSLVRTLDDGPSSSPWGPGLSAQQRGDLAVVALAGPMDRELAQRADALLQLTTLEHAGRVAIDVSAVEEVNGTLIGVLLRASRRLAWRNRELTIVCDKPDARARLAIAGLDELATLVASAT
jgi:anti-anti-sigma regulatory factor